MDIQKLDPGGDQEWKISLQRNSAYPDRWMKTWHEDFIAGHPGWTYKNWTLEEIKNGTFFCTNLYANGDQSLDRLAASLLGLEIIYQHGGYLVPQSVVWKSGEEACGPEPSTALGFFEASSGVVGGCIESAEALDRIRNLYEGKQMSGEDQQHTKIIARGSFGSEMCKGYSHALLSNLSYPEWSRFLGAEVIFDLVANDATDSTIVLWAYDSNVPCERIGSKWDTVRAFSGRSILVLDPFLFHYVSLWDSIPKFVLDLDAQHPGWKFLVLCLEWETGEDIIVTYRTTVPCLSPRARAVAVIVNAHAGSLIPSTPAVSAIVGSILSLHGSVPVFVGCQKFPQTKELSDIFAAVAPVRNAFRTIANHEAPFVYDRHELHGRNWKGFLANRLSFELIMEDDGRTLYRSWNDDGNLNCEIKMTTRGMSGKSVEWVKVYYGSKIVFEATNRRL
eukprot:CAMPEP_0184671224 /NCGR_PEP_ID=MMETSP0308-20130426/85371_1 /TAXON_ID=38269 /ORGANISM="Gloeochaete witrockiana, Strain SAG 46.84" /LENGTH=447 /DNA_ID=CAMNT_0027118309 /DNA_START=1798 /DNA_END=3141 /DNA_ORIENTATION=+